MGKITINDIAKKAGVAKSTVSRVLNGTNNVKPETRETIQAIIEETGYQPSEVARGLSTSKSNVIGVIIPNAASNFFGRILEGISEVAEKRGYTVLFCNTNNDWNRERLALQRMRGQCIRGLLGTSSASYESEPTRKEFLREVQKLGCPVVLVDRDIKHSGYDGVYFDNFNGAYIATEALLEKRHGRIGAIISDIALDLGQQRKDGFLQAFQNKQRVPDSTCTVFANQQISLMDSYRIATDWIKENRLPDAVFLSNGMIANGFLKALIENGLRPGKDIECMGFDFVEVLDILNLRYSYLDRDALNMGRIAAQMLFEPAREGQRIHIIPAKPIENK